MAQYNRMQINPLKKEWEKTGTAILTEEEATTLNDSSKQTKVKYESVTKKKVTKK